MEPLNKAERNASIFNFIAIYIIVLALPVTVAYLIGKHNPDKGAGGNQIAIREQQMLLSQLDQIQAYLVEMNKIDKNDRPQGTVTSDQMSRWISDAKAQNEKFLNTGINAFAQGKFSDARKQLQTKILACLMELHNQRRLYLLKADEMILSRNQSNNIEQLKSENRNLLSERQTLQNQLNMMIAQQQKDGPGGGGSQSSDKAVEDLRWEMRFTDANCKKAQADLLEAYSNEINKRRQLYTQAKTNFQAISRNNRISYVLQQQANDKIQEIDKAMSHL